MTDFQEEWKPVVGYEGIYEISNHGRVKRLGGTNSCSKDRILKNCTIKDGYLGLTLSKDNKKFNAVIHRLVAEAFIGERPSCHDINHKDGNKANPAVWNLEYITSSENQYHAYRNNLKKPLVGEAHQNTKLLESQVMEILLLKSNISQSKLAKRFNVSQGTISDIVCRRTWRHIK